MRESSAARCFRYIVPTTRRSYPNRLVSVSDPPDGRDIGGSSVVTEFRLLFHQVGMASRCCA